MVSNISRDYGNSLHGVRRAQQSERLKILETSATETATSQSVEAAAARTTAPLTMNSGIMASNFVSAGCEKSKYVNAKLTAFQSDNDMAARQSAILSAGLTELSALSEKDSENYALRALIGRKAARRIQREQQQSAAEESQRNLEEIKDTLEERAQQAAMPQDKNGVPIEKAPNESTGENAPAPEKSADQPKPAPPPTVDVPAPEIATPTLSAPAINITV